MRRRTRIISPHTAPVTLGNCACDDPSWVDPIFDYGHQGGLCCVIGGYVYRGNAIPWLQGAYVFGDFCSGTVWSMRYDGSNVTEFLDWSDDLQPCDGSIMDHINSFGQDADGELYIVDGLGGEIFKIVPGESSTWNYCPVVPNSAGAGTVISHTGTTHWTDNDFVLTVHGSIPNQFCKAWCKRSMG